MDIPFEVSRRLAMGQRFNAYEMNEGFGWIIAIGSVTDFVELARARDPVMADFMLRALRHMAPEQ